jgi:hypothetical protein
MTRLTKNTTGKKHEILIGTRAQVWHGTAYKTTGGLTKHDLIQNKSGRIVSKLKHTSAKKDKRLLKFGYGTQKGKFGFVKLSSKSKSMRGGNAIGNMTTAMKTSGTNQMAQNAHNTLNTAKANMAHNIKNGGRRIKHNGTRRHKIGGNLTNIPLSPSYYDGKGVGTSGVDLQFVAGNAA